MSEDKLPDQEQGEVVEGELVGHEEPASFLRRLLTRAALGILLLVVGLAFTVSGLFLTLIIVGAPLGVPLTLIGLLFCVLASFLLFGRGKLVIRKGP